MEAEQIEVLKAAFATAMRRHRHAKRLSQEQLGFETGLSMGFISLLETGKRQPTLTTMAILAHALNVRLVDLLADIEK